VSKINGPLQINGPLHRELLEEVLNLNFIKILGS